MTLGAAPMVTWAIASEAVADGQFSAVTYNVAGLLEPFSSSNPAANTPIISCKLRGYTLVNVQEDFNYHSLLYDRCDDHPFRSATSGGMGFGSGLNTLSYLPFSDFERAAWKACNGVDCLTPKGFTHARVRLEEGGYLSVYNLHTQAQTEPRDLDARRADIVQLLAFIEANSPTDAVLVMGDTNTRYTRSGDNTREFLRHGFHDVWIDLARGGVLPGQGDAALTSCPDLSGAECEVVDKVFYRDSAHLTLRPLSYRVDRSEFVNAQGSPLSDHFPVIVQFAHGTTGRFRLSDQVGGPHGQAYNDVGLLPDAPALSQVMLRSGSRVDAVELVLSNGAILRHGGSGDSPAQLTLSQGEYLASAEVCIGEHGGHTRVFHVALTTSTGRVLAGGTATDQCTTFVAPVGYGIVGLHGRAGDELDKVGLIYARQVSPVHSPEPYVQIKNRRSGLCMDVMNADMASGSNVQQWTCHGGDWQKWTYDPLTGLIRSKHDPHYCLDNLGYYGDGADLRIWSCNGNANQRFTMDRTQGSIHMRTAPEQVIDGVGTSPGDEIITWTDWNGDNQRWLFEP
jgi:endonuclease/exonuclease/phosphatase family metal-dependent hydrolase